MHEISWDNNFNTGISKIDLQHQCFIGIINELSQMVGKTENLQILSAKLQELYKYTEYHFCSEELVMMELEYPGYEDHKRVHQILLTGLLEKINTVKYKTTTVEEIIRYLFMWFAGHTVDDDKNIANWLGEKTAT